MKKLLLTMLAVLASSVAIANVLPQRSANTGIKVLNRATKQHTTTMRALAQQVREGEPSAEVPSVFYEVPFEHSLGKNQSDICANYVAVDANNDTKGWKIGGYTAYSVCMKPAAEDVNACDDWLISPAIHLFAGKTYIISFEIGSALSSGIEEKMSVCIGTAQTVEAMTSTIIENLKNTSKKTFEKNSREFSVETDGYYYIGFHAISEKEKSGNPKLCNFAIADKANVVDPPAAGQIKYNLAPEGELKASVKYTAPLLTVSEATLTEISKVVVKVNNSVATEIIDVVPGADCTFDVDLRNGFNTIEATAYVGETAGTAVKTDTFYAGLDNPLPVENLTISLSDDYKNVILSWDAVSTVGENGGYVDPSKVTYYIFDAFGSYYDPAIATTNETSVVLDYSDVAGQDFAAFQVTAGMDETYYSLASTSDIVVTGAPDMAPAGESFANRSLALPWMQNPDNTYNAFMTGIMGDNELQTNADQEDAEPEYLNSQDADNGFLYILPYEKDAYYGIQSVKFDISQAANPVLEFFYQGMGSELVALVSKDGGEFQTVNTINLQENPTSGWTLCRTDLSAFKDARYIRVEIALRAIHNTDELTWSVPVDNIRVRDLVDTDVRLAAVSAPASIDAGSDILVKASVENLGTLAAQNVVVTITDADGNATSQTIASMEPNEVKQLALAYPTSVLSPESILLNVSVAADGDAEASNNSASLEVKVKFAEYPTVSDLAGSADNAGNVALTWTAPDFAELTKPQSRTEDFESADYPVLTIEDFGGWTLYDGDGSRTYTFLRDFNNPYATQPMAFQLFDPEAAGVPEDDRIDCPSHSGKRYLMAFSAKGLNDNWLISPELSGNAQTISLFARSFTVAYPESFRVLYSTTDKLPDSFIEVDAVKNYPADGVVPEEWTEFKATLPAGAKYFAINHDAYDTYGLMVDDIAFEAAGTMPADATIVGYNVFRNGVKVNEQPVAETGYADAVAETGTYKYCVSTVYSCGESKACAPIEIVVDDVSAADVVAAQHITIVAGKGTIEVRGAQGQLLTVANAAGALCHSAIAADNSRISLPAGIYLVEVGRKVAKVIVR